MTRPAARRLAACLLTGLLTVLAAGLLPSQAGTAAAAAEDTSAAPLQVTIESLAPSTIPRHGRITITGRITNRSDLTWTNLQAYMFTSAAPMRTSEELAAAARTDPTAEVGARLYKPGLYDDVGDLGPGQSTNYVLSVPRHALQITGEPGVYWVGVHVLGGNLNGRDGIADGRARTFMPLMSPRGPGTSMSLVVPIQGPVERLSDGSLARADAWKRRFGNDGRLGRLLSLCATADQPFTWVVDPAVLDAATAIAHGNPSIAIAPSNDTGSSPAPSPSPSPSPSESPSGTPSGSTGQGSPALNPAQQAAADWVRGFQAQASGRAVLAMPYGNLDVASVMRHQDEPLYRRAAALSADTLRKLGVTASPAVSPPRGFLPEVAVHQLSSATTVLLGDRAVPGAATPVLTGGAPQGLATGTGSAVPPRGARPSLVLIDSTASSGGPGPTPRFDPLAIRQRLVSEAAVHALSPDRAEPLVVSTPDLWNPGPDWRTSEFFAGLDLPWLHHVDVPTVLAGAGSPAGPAPTADKLVYPRARRAAELPQANLQATRELVRTGQVLSGLLTDNDTVDTTLAKSGMLASSVRVRQHPKVAQDHATGAARRIRTLMQRVRIDGPSFVTMSSQEGTFAVTIVNGLRQSVTVGVEADTGSPDLSITAPDPVTLAAGQRASVRLHATARDIGVHSVRLLPTNANGVPVAAGTRFSVRSSQVGLVIWIIMGVGAGVLLVASAVRIVRRVRHRDRSRVRVTS
ncbi:MAG TPA: DUF6049 family protein [Nocardioidaceae bacterium]|nr:DUF6049 family protein [Nocardioidaceae bacterium]